MAEGTEIAVGRVAGADKKEPTRMEQLFNISIFALFAVLWAIFAYALVANQGGLDAVWEWARNQHILIQGTIALLVLPLALGLWIWESGWPLLVRLVLIVSIGGWNLWMFFPKDLLDR